MDNYDRDLYQMLSANEDIAELPFSERQKAISDLLSSARNIFSRVNKISRKVKADGSPGKYEASQYLLVHRPVPVQLLSQLKGKLSAAAEDTKIGDIFGKLYTEKKVDVEGGNVDDDEEQVQQLIDQAENELNRAQEVDEDELIMQNVKLQKQSHQQEIYTNILEELAKMKQRRLYKVDSRFTHTGKELLNRRGGGDLGSNPSSGIPLINTKAARKLDWQNKKKLQEGIDVAFGKEKKKLQQKINLKKLGKNASRSV